MIGDENESVRCGKELTGSVVVVFVPTFWCAVARDLEFIKASNHYKQGTHALFDDPYLSREGGYIISQFNINNESMEEKATRLVEKAWERFGELAPGNRLCECYPVDPSEKGP